MFKRSEKKIKAVFKMQFQVTQVPQMKAKGLMISLVPVDVGKPTVRLPKAPIAEGTCTWENPVYEAVKLVKEIKTGRIREKFYYFIVSTGSSNSGFLGEVSVDFADLAEANKPLKLTLPLQTSKSGAILQVTAQRIQGDPNSRCMEDDLSPMNESDECLDTELSDCYSRGKRNINSSEVRSLIISKEIYSTVQENQKEKMEMQHHYTESLATVKQLKLQVASLEEEVKSQELHYSGSLITINELEIQVENLQKELENQAQAFEEDLDAVTQAKIMQEQRAIRAEKAFRKTRWNNANAAERLQEEFKRHSADMSLKIEENEKLAQISIAEANDLRRRNEILEDQLQKAEEEHHIKRDEYERILHDLQEQNEGIWVKEKEDLEEEVASGRKEAEELIQENISLKSQIDQAKTKEENLHLEMKKLRQKNNEVKNNLLEAESEKEDLKTEVSKLQIDLYNEKEERAALQNSIRSPVKANNLVYNTAEEESNTQTNLTYQLEQVSAPAKDINYRPVEERSNGIDDLPTTGELDTEHIKRATHQTMLEQKSDHFSGSCDTSSLFSEVTSLREKNIGMEEKLKEMHERYSEISLRFAEVEGERQQLVMTLRNLKNGKKN